MLSWQRLPVLFVAPFFASAGPAEKYLSEDFFPGMHILERASPSADEMRIHRRSQIPSAGLQPLTVNIAAWHTISDARVELQQLLSIPEQEELQLPWAMFDPQGRHIEGLQALKQELVVFLLEIGVWMWPAVRIGFEQEVTNVGQHGAPVTLKTLSVRPVVFEVKDFMTYDETEAVMQLGAAQGLVASGGILQSSDLEKGTKSSDFRTSKQAWLANAMSPVVAELDARTSRLTRVPASHNEDVQILRYDEGNFYHSHMDWTELELYPDQKSVWSQSHMGYEDRLATVFWYLNDIDQGGETVFPKFGQVICSPDSRGGLGTRTCPGAQDPVMSDCSRGLKVRPTRGSVILWYNYLASARGDRNALHAGCPVGNNLTKWSGNKWVHIKSLGERGKWIDGHPALKRFGWTGPEKDPNACSISFSNEAGEDVSLLWLPDGAQTGNVLVELKIGEQINQQSYKGHRFQMSSIRSKKKSNIMLCEPPSATLVLDKQFKLKAKQRERHEL